MQLLTYFDEPCPVCMRHHDTFPIECMHIVEEALIRAQVESICESKLQAVNELSRHMQTYALFWVTTNDGNDADEEDEDDNFDS